MNHLFEQEHPSKSLTKRCFNGYAFIIGLIKVRKPALFVNSNIFLLLPTQLKYSTIFKIIYNETHVSTQQKEKKKQTWFYGENGYA